MDTSHDLRALWKLLPIDLQHYILEDILGLKPPLDSKQLPSICSLGRGFSGFIYETNWEGNKYARKDFPLGSEEGNFVFENEAYSLFQLDHPNIVKCFGYTVGDSSCSLVQEYVDGDLPSTIQRRIEAQRNEHSRGSRGSIRVVDADEIKSLLSSEVEVRKSTKVGESSSLTPGSAVPFDVREAVDIISQIAAAMKYLHDNGIVHGDLKPKNVLLNSDSGKMTVKVADFGLIESKKRIKLVSKRKLHFEILMWKAPELLEELLGPLIEDSDDPFTDSDTDEDMRFGSRDREDFKILAMADVYSFGLTCSHILGCKVAYDADLSLTVLRKYGIMPNLSSSAICPDYLRDLIYSCLESEPFRRPTFSDISARLTTAMLDLPQIPEGGEPDLFQVPEDEKWSLANSESVQLLSQAEQERADLLLIYPKAKVEGTRITTFHYIFIVKYFLFHLTLSQSVPHAKACARLLHRLSRELKSVPSFESDQPLRWFGLSDYNGWLGDMLFHMVEYIKTPDTSSLPDGYVYVRRSTDIYEHFLVHAAIELQDPEWTAKCLDQCHRPGFGTLYP